MSISHSDAMNIQEALRPTTSALLKIAEALGKKYEHSLPDTSATILSRECGKCSIPITESEYMLGHGLCGLCRTDTD